MSDIKNGLGSKRAQRQADIAEYVLQNGSATAADLAERFAVSTMTIHRDLDELERQRIVRKHRGGVSVQPSSIFESNVAYRMRSAVREKRALARRARELIEPGMAIMIDGSTTTLELARLLDDIPLTVVTNFMGAITVIRDLPNIRLIALGGEWYRPHESFLGVPCIEAIDALRVDLLFASISAVSGGFTYHQEQEVVLVKQAMMRAAQRSILMVDHTKLDRVALHRVAPLPAWDLVLTDDAAPERTLQEMRDQGIPYELVPSEHD
ncbi:DeoR family transcriptional regulator [Nonomuraea phyllanthi]|uniref:DeoR/GlpR family DNA-binding transcription regulator n=1 Tax=Nonomuraea phyllanthi TaxID=2219224 RepID=UPI0012931766|nr:DeoR/GlpR family DNA-binding transcription regulator [Nonomuraea phyllanthi]QFY07557.1 DeoR family transcriptional regulator [Nonomuraea phyllanthi]